MIKSVIEVIRRLTEPAYFKLVLIPRAKIRQYKCVRRIQNTKKVRVAFLVCSLPMWRSQSLFNRIRRDPRFEVFVAAYPTYRITVKGEITGTMRELRDFFLTQDVPLLDLSNEPSPGKVFRESINPDIIFYPQPYNNLFGNDLDNQYFFDKLICYIPYGLFAVNGRWLDRNFLNNTAWRLFYHSEVYKKQAESVLFNHGSNIRITGDPISDLFINEESTKEGAWKPQGQEKKRVIWAPHHSIIGGNLCQDSFIWLSETMLKLSEQYKDKIQFSFKPHPVLYKMLCDFPGWGKQRTEMYYNRWRDGINTQLDEGPYVDLFKESDAMIHDSCSFTVEYHFTGKPVLFTTKDREFSIGQLNAIGKAAFSAHYLCDSEAGIVSFIERTVLGSYDPMKADREAFYNNYLRMPDGGSASENIYNEIVLGLKLE